MAGSASLSPSERRGALEIADADLPPSLRDVRIALVHDYLNQQGGAERVVEVFAELFPTAPIYTSVYDRGRMPEVWKRHTIRTSFLQRISPRLGLARALVPLYPMAFELFDFRGFDLVLSSTTAFAKSVITRPETCHICYCNNPTRFLWMYHDYFEYERVPRPVQSALPLLMSPLRVWDFASAQRVDHFVAGSYNAARRIAKYYRRDSDVIQPPIDASFYHPCSDSAGDYFLVVSRLQPYKRIDLAVQACTRLGVPLHVVGEGPDGSRLKQMAGPCVQFLGRLTDEEVRSQMSACRALIVPGEEDFGLTPLETQACGRPVVAYAAGGALETVREGETGLFFRRQTIEGLCSALAAFEDRFDPEALRSHALQFDKVAFKERLLTMLARRFAEHRARFAPEG